MLCTKCGTLLKENEKTCPICGAINNNVQPPKSVEQPVPVVEPVKPVEEKVNTVIDPVKTVPQDDIFDNTLVQQPVFATPNDGYISRAGREPIYGSNYPEQGVQNMGANSFNSQAPTINPDEVAKATRMQEPTEKRPTAYETIGEEEVKEISASVVKAASPTEEKEKKKGGSGKVLIFLIIIVGLVVAGFIITKNLFPEKEKINPTPTSTPEPTVAPIEDPTIANYGGYSFKIPEGFTKKEDSTYGVIFSNDTIAYSVKIDYTNTYATYKEELAKIYFDQADSLEVTYETTTYLILQEKDETTNTRALHYVYKATDDISFIGVIIRKDKEPGQMDDLKVLTELLNGSEAYEKNLKPGNKYDSGIGGIITLPTNYASSFIFEESTTEETPSVTETPTVTETTTE